MNSIDPRPNSPSTDGERDELVGRGVVRRHAAAVVRDVQLELRRREADRAVGQRGADEHLHRRDLVGRRRALRRVVAHDEAADRAVAHVGADVHADAALEPVEEGAEATAPVGDALGERVGRHALDPAEHLQQPRDVLGLRRREGEPAVAGEERGDAVPRRGRRRRVPVQLRVVVRVHVDEAGRDEQAVGVDHRAQRSRRAVRSRRSGRRRPRRRRCGPGRRCRRRRCRPGSGGQASMPYERHRVEAVERAALGVGQVVVVLAQLVDDAGVLRVVVREVRRPDDSGRRRRSGRAVPACARRGRS